MDGTKHPGGRPTEYDPSYPQKVLDYLETCGREQTKLPKRVDIAIMLDCTEDTLNNWAKQNPEFLGALDRVDNFQHSQLVDDGIYGGKEVNSQIVKLLLYNHGYRERSDVTTDDKPIENLVVIKDGSQTQ